MTRRFVDLSIFLENDVLSDPPAFAPKIQYFSHENTFEQIEPFFPGLQREDLPVELRLEHLRRHPIVRRRDGSR